MEQGARALSAPQSPRTSSRCHPRGARTLACVDFDAAPGAHPERGGQEQGPRCGVEPAMTCCSQIANGCRRSSWRQDGYAFLPSAPHELISVQIFASPQSSIDRRMTRTHGSGCPRDHSLRGRHQDASDSRDRARCTPRELIDAECRARAPTAERAQRASAFPSCEVSRRGIRLGRRGGRTDRVWVLCDYLH